MTSKEESKAGTKVTKFRTNYDADFKTTVVKYAIQNSNKAASDHFGINESNIRRWKRLSLKAEFLESSVGRRALVKKARVRRKATGRTRRKKKVSSSSHEDEEQGSSNDIDSMPLQQRLTAISSASKEPEKPVQTLKSQPLSPTKLKVTRQSTSRAQQKEEEVAKPVTEEICLKWNTHHSNMQTAFPALLSKEQYCDVTLVAEGRSLKCHKLILSSCSSYFDEVLEKVVPYQHPIIFMKDIPYHIMKALCDFMYVGEVNIVHSDLDQILSVGNSLNIKGLAKRPETSEKNENSSTLDSNTALDSEKNDPSHDTEITDPLDLMEPTYEEAATPDIPPIAKRNDQTRKSTGKRVRKRKHVEVDHEPSPPVFRMRKGTRSRPNVRVPRYFNANFDNSAPAPTPEPEDYVEPPHETEEPFDSYLNILEHIKTEPLDIEDNMISYDEENFHHEMPEQNVSMQVEEETQKVVKRRKLTRSATEQDKPDPLKLEKRPVKRRRRGRKPWKRVENSDDIQNSIAAVAQLDLQNNVGEIGDGVNMEIENSDRPLENSDRLELPVDNSDVGDLPMEDSDEELRGFESCDSRLENTTISVLENSDFTTVTTVTNEEIENAVDEGINDLDTLCDNVENCESIGYQIRIEKSYTDETDEGKFHGFETVGDEIDGYIEEPIGSSIPESANCLNTEDNSDTAAVDGENIEPNEIDEESLLTELHTGDEDTEVLSTVLKDVESISTLPKNNESRHDEEIHVNISINTENTGDITLLKEMDETENMEESVLENMEIDIGEGELQTPSITEVQSSPIESSSGDCLTNSEGQNDEAS